MCFFFGLSKDEINNILSKKELNTSEEWVLASIVRLYNMHLKLGHSARITYVAEQELKNIPSVPQKSVLERTVLLSALLHDVGRFYQAGHYNDLVDSRMRKQENTINGLEVDHAVAGYYYSLASAFELHKLGVYNDDQEVLRYITEAIAAVVVKCHQKPNTSLNYFDYNGSSSVLEDEHLLSDSYQFLNRVYDKAKLMDSHIQGEFDSKHQEFIDNFVKKIKNILNHREMDYSVASGFDIDTTQTDDVYSDIDSEIHSVLGNIQGKSVSEVSDSIIQIMNHKIQDLSHDALKPEEVEAYRKEIQELLKGMMNFDVASSMEEIFKNERDIPESVRFLISSSLSMTMDADKIDILNQRALGIYNTSYQFKDVSIFPVNNLSLIEILNQYFHFHIDPDDIVIDSKMRSVISRMSPEVHQMLQEYLGNVNLFDTNKYPEHLDIHIKKGQIIINGIPYGDDKYYDMFHQSWNEFTSYHLGLEDLPFKEFKNKYFRGLQITVPRDVIDSNIESLSDDQKVEVYRKLFVSDGLKKRFQLEKENGIQSGWIKAIDEAESDHLVNSSISGLLWQINQFIMVNMRNKHSYEFIEKYHFLDQIYEQYLEKDPVVANIIKEYIDYTKEFMRFAMKNVHGDMLTEEVLDHLREEFYQSQNGQKQVSYI